MNRDRYHVVLRLSNDFAPILPLHSLFYHYHIAVDGTHVTRYIWHQRANTRTRKQGTMKAIRLHSRSVPTGMVYEEAPRPHPEEGEVLVRVYAAAMTPGEHLWPETWKSATGQQ